MAKIEQFITTNIRIPRGDLKTLKRDAFEHGKSVSSVLRELIAGHLRGKKKSLHKTARRHSIWDLPKIARKTGDPNLSLKVDAIVYGTKK